MLEKQRLHDSGDPEVGRSFVLSKFGASRFDVSGDGAGFKINSSLLRLGNVELLRSHSTAVIKTEFPEAGFYRQYFILHGSSRITIERGQQFDLSRNTSAVVDPGRRITVHTGVNLEHLILRIDREALKRKLEALLNASIDHAPTMGNAVDSRSRLMEDMRRAIALFVSDADGFGPYFSDIAHKEIEQSLIARFLFCHSHEYIERLLKPPQRPSFSQLRLIEEYIEANWDKPLAMEALVKMSGLSARSIFRHFKSVRNCSPFDFIKKVRLERARYLLSSRDDDVSVLRVALMCGFQSFGHFSRNYRRAFGELPSATMRRFRSDG